MGFFCGEVVSLQLRSFLVSAGEEEVGHGLNLPGRPGSDLSKAPVIGRELKELRRHDGCRHPKPRRRDQIFPDPVGLKAVADCLQIDPNDATFAVQLVTAETSQTSSECALKSR